MVSRPSLLLAMFVGATAIGEGVRAEPAAEPQKAYGSDLITKWGQALDPQTVWREYPRPQLEARQLDLPQRPVGLRRHQA